MENALRFEYSICTALFHLLFFDNVTGIRSCITEENVEKTNLQKGSIDGRAGL